MNDAQAEEIKRLFGVTTEAFLNDIYQIAEDQVGNLACITRET